MRVEKKHLADLEMVYAVAAFHMNGKEYCLAASEKKGGSCLLLDPQTGERWELWDRPGGVMTLLQVPGRNAFLSIEEFYPVFLSEKAGVYETTLSFENGNLKTEKIKLCDLPFVHRVGLMEEEDGLYLMGASLCSGKDYVEDWSRPGGIYIGKYEYGCPVTLTEVYHGLTKNHGMYIEKEGQGSTAYIGAQEGVAKCWRNRQYGQWECRLLDLGETSDIWLSDVDGDGEKEMAVIQGFHGGSIRIFKSYEKNPRKFSEIPICFGHVLWAGEILGNRCIIGGSRDGDKELAVYELTQDGGTCRKTILDQEMAPTQIAVGGRSGSSCIYTANHGAGSVDMYTLV